MKDSRCSRCATPFFVGELVGVEEGRVLCCMCLDLRTAWLEIVRHAEGNRGSEDQGASSYRSPPPPRNG